MTETELAFYYVPSGADAPPRLRFGLHDLVRAANLEFVPPLGFRGPMKDFALEEAASAAASAQVEAEPVKYLEQMDGQPAILALDEDGTLLGFASFVENRDLSESLGVVATIYLSTIIVGSNARRRGVAAKLYEALFRHARTLDDAAIIVTRTWSTNASHIPLLGRLGFSVAKRLPDDRGPGVDTLYFRKDL